MNSNESITLSDNDRGAEPPAPSACDDSGEVLAGCNAIGSATLPMELPSVCDDSGEDSGEVQPGCNTIGSATLLDTQKARDGAPNRVINLTNLQSTVDNFLGPCPACKGILNLEEKYTVSYATTLEIVCKACNENRVGKLQRVRNLNRSIKKITDTSVASMGKMRKKKKQVYYLKDVVKSMNKLRSDRTIRPTRNKRLGKRSRIKAAGRQGALESEINIRAIMSAYYTGTGGFDIGNVTAFLGIPGGKSWERTYHRHSPSMAKHIIQVANDSMGGALNEEIKATIREKLEGIYEKEKIDGAITAWFAKDEPNIPDEIKTVGLSISYDMGWQKRSTGRVFDSISGHAFMIGCRTGKVIKYDVRQTKCKKCEAQNKHGTSPVSHNCMINWEGGSGAMEAGTALDMTVEVYNSMEGRVFIETIVSDDDSTMRSHLQHESNGGKLVETIPQPEFLADPSHRIKVMATPIFGLVKDTKNPHECKKIDAMRIKKYIGCYIYKNRNLPFDEFVNNARAPVEHLFDCHEWCNKEWCWAKELDENQHKVILQNMKICQQCDLPAFSSSSVSSSSSSSPSSDESLARSLNAYPSAPNSSQPNLNPEISDDSKWSSEDESSDSETDGSICEIDSDEINECNFFTKHDGTYDNPENIFTPAEVDELKKRERIMIERNTKGYYRSKQNDHELYTEIMRVYERFIQPNMLKQVWHRWNTQKNEAMNTSVAALAPKNKTYSMSESLRTRVAIAAGCQIVGFAKFWSICCQSLGFQIDSNLLSLLEARDKTKRNKNVRSSTKKGKASRSNLKYEKYNSAFKKQQDGHKEGMGYKSGIAAVAAKKNLPTAKDRNPKGTPQDKLRCPFHHPNYCTLLGHRDARSKVCMMHGKSKEERSAAAKVIQKELIAIEVEKMKNEGKLQNILLT